MEGSVVWGGIFRKIIQSYPPPKDSELELTGKHILSMHEAWVPCPVLKKDKGKHLTSKALKPQLTKYQH